MNTFIAGHEWYNALLLGRQVSLYSGHAAVLCPARAGL